MWDDFNYYDESIVKYTQKVNDFEEIITLFLGTLFFDFYSHGFY
jgi:hypothetical protein